MRNEPKRASLPVGLGMALAQDEAAMRRFSALPSAEKSAFIARAKDVRSSAAMQTLVRSLTDEI